MTFQSGLMTCVVCGKEQHSDPDTESNWRALVLDDVTYYACTDHFPLDGASREQFRDAYIRVLEVCFEKHGTCPRHVCTPNTCTGGIQ